jgi:hypothetical protein
MIRLPRELLIYAAFLAALLILAVIGVTAAKAIWSAAAVHPANRDFNRDFDGGDYDYVEGLAERGIVKLPGYEHPPAVPINAAATK